MIDPITAFTAASAAFTGIKKLVQTGRELEDISGQLGAWYGAVADITRAESQRKNPTFLDKMSHGTESIEQEAMDIVVRKKTLAEKEKEISQDDLKKHTSEIQKITDDFTKKIEEIALAKKNEILTV